MKKIFAVILTVALLFTMLPTGLFGLTASAAKDGYYTYSVSGGKATITDVNTSISGAVTIPSTLGGYPVTSIGSSAFRSCSSLTSINIPNSVTSIGSWAFYWCTSLTSITIPDSVTSIGGYAFEDCSSLTGITIPDSVISIGFYAFYNTGYYNNSSNWENDVLYVGNHLIGAKPSISGSYTIKTGTITIADYAFYNCEGLTGITIPDSVTSIGNGAFQNCSSLTSITIPDSVTSIGNDAFQNCSSLTSITIPDSVTSIGEDAFYNTGYYNNSSNWENDVLYIGNHLVEAKTSVSGSYTIKADTITIAGSAFEYCSSLTDITIPDSVTTIGNDAFAYCSSLISITIPDSVTSIGDYAFYNCGGLKKVFYSGTQAQWNAIAGGSGNGYFKNATLQFVTYDDGHYFYDVIDKQPTCDAVGVKHEECSICGEIRNENTEIPATGEHKVLENVYTISNSSSYPFALNNGTYNSTNKSDNSTSTFTITATHNATLEIEYSTSTELGCDKLTVKQNSTTKVTASGTTSWTKLTLSLTAGDTVYITYSKDGSAANGNDEIYFRLSGGQGLVSTDEVDPTCTEPVICDVCGQVAKDPAHNYEWVVVIEPTCVARGFKQQECTVCGDVQNMYTVVPATGVHTFEWITDTEPTCGATGTKHENCSVCGLVQSENTVIPATGNHTFEWVTDTEPTCDATGAKHENCSVCGLVQSENTVIPATGNHTFEWVTDTEPTCTTNGVKHEECFVCGAVRNADTVIPATGNHTYDWVVMVEPTCVDVGFKQEQCSGCGKIQNAYTVISATGVHTYDNYKDADCNICGFVRDISNIKTGTTGDCTWILIGTDLTITGNGAMQDYSWSSFNAAPWGRSITSVHIEYGVTYIGSNAFYNCTDLTKIILPNDAINIGSGAFDNSGYYNDSNNWQENVLYIGNHLIEAKTSISGSYTIKPKTLTIAEDAFSGCGSITNIIIPNTVTTISEYAFYNCNALTSITIPEGVTSIGDYAFSDCTNIISITLPNSVNHIGSRAFYNTGYYNNANNWQKSVLYIGNHLIEAKDSISDSYAIRLGTVTIADDAFGECKSLVGVTIPNSVISIGNGAFGGCICFTTVIIPDSVTSIGNYAFIECSNLTSITIGDGVTTIGNYAFEYCTALKNVIIPNSVITIGKGAFCGCSNLTSITIPDSITSIAGYVFCGCSNLTSVTILGNITTIGESAFWGCSSLTSISLPRSITKIAGSAFSGCSGLKNVFFGGTQAQWNAISIGSENSSLTNATVHFVNCDNGHTYDNACDVICNICGTVREISHSFEWVTDTEPTCGVAGVKHELCSVCGAVRNENTVIPATGEHTFAWVTNTEPTCGAAGAKHELCSVCGETRNENTEIPATGNHTYDNDHDADCNTCGAEREVEPPVGNNVQILGSSMVCVDGTIELIVNLTDCADVTSVGVTLSHSDCFQFVSAEWLQAGSLEVFDTNTNKGALGGLESANINGNLFKITLKATKEIETAEVSVQVTAKNGTAVVMDATATKEITFGLRGDLNGDNEVSDADAVYLLMHTFFADFYPVNQDCDFNGDTVVSDADAVYLLMYTFFPDFYPIG